MRKIISPAILIILCLFISEIAFTQPGPLNRPKDVNAIANKQLPNTIDKNLVAEGQPKVLVTTKEVKYITSSGATCYYSVMFEGLTLGVDIRASSGGVCVSKSAGPTINNPKFGVSKNCSLTSATTCSDITGLAPNSRYYVRAFYTITDGKITGTFYGNELTFMTTAPTGSK
jgi:hypothetical protein